MSRSPRTPGLGVSERLLGRLARRRRDNFTRLLPAHSAESLGGQSHPLDADDSAHLVLLGLLGHLLSIRDSGDD